MPEMIPMVLFLSAAAVLILRPLTKRLGLLLEALAKERLGGLEPQRAGRLDESHMARITVALDQLNSRLDLIDERMAFVERLVEARPRQRLTG